MPRVMTSALISANGHQTIDRRAAFSFNCGGQPTARLICSPICDSTSRACGKNRAHGVEIVNHAVMADVLDGNAGRHQFSCIGIAFIAHRIELGGMDDRGRKSG